MVCNCNKKRQQFEVVAETGKVVFTSGSRPTADAVSRRYPGSTVREKAKPKTDTTKTTSTKKAADRA